MKNSFFIITLLLITTFSSAQKIKKVSVKDESGLKETYSVLKSDPSVRHGEYKKATNYLLVKGQYSHGERSGVWEYYSPKSKLVQQYDFTSDTLLYNYNGLEYAMDSTQYTRSIVILGGLYPVLKQVGRSIRYPAEAKKNRTEGKVNVKFVVDAKGNVKQMEVVEGIGDGCDEEVMKAFQGVEFECIPALDLKGSPVESEFVLPISFKLD
ncbi:energy transducer TonB [Limibacter armeniacum]|uniref:energy transducer TonB n=1 Tax=Limibacter armeniacum TaxID=466084 RepID=UPI002FE615C3